jgi:O-antigen ligase
MRYLEKIYPWVLLSPVILPVIVWGELVYPYLVPKTVAFYALSFVSAGLFVILASRGVPFYTRRLGRWEAWIPGSLLVLAYLASFFGIDFYRSFWSILVRGDGLLMLTCAVAGFYLIVVSADRAFLRRLLLATASIGSFVALYGIGEWFLGGGRIGSLLGNAAFFAGYLGVALFATLWAAEHLPSGWRKLAYSGALLQVIAIVLSATRGTILALAVALVVYLLLLAFTGEGRERTIAGALIAVFVLIAALFFGFRGELAHVSFSPVARIASISATDPDVASRLFIWKNMIGEIGKTPWLGVGAEHIDALFNRFYDPTLISEQWFDRSHNAFLDYAAQYGIGGLLLYLALIASFITSSVRLMRQGKRRYGAVTLLLAVTYATQNFFVFDTVSSFWLMLALLAVSYAASLGDSPLEPITLPAFSAYVSWAVAAGLVLLVIPVSIRPFEAAYDLAQAYHYQLTDVSREVDYLSHGFALGTYADVEYGYEAYDMYANNQAARLSGQGRVDAYHAALSILTTDFNRYPYDARTALYLSHVLLLAPASEPIDQDLLSSALERAIRLSPKRAQPWYILTNLSLTEANSHPAGSAERTAGYAAARDLLTRYIGLVPKLSEPHFVLAELEYATGDIKSAASEAALGKEYYVRDLETAKRAAVYYENARDLPDAAFFLGEVIHFDPTDAAAASDLAKIRSYESE